MLAAIGHTDDRPHRGPEPDDQEYTCALVLLPTVAVSAGPGGPAGVQSVEML